MHYFRVERVYEQFHPIDNVNVHLLYIPGVLNTSSLKSGCLALISIILEVSPERVAEMSGTNLLGCIMPKSSILLYYYMTSRQIYLSLCYLTSRIIGTELDVKFLLDTYSFTDTQLTRLFNRRRYFDSHPRVILALSRQQQ